MKQKNLVSDLISGLTSGIADIPDGMASAVLAGANPVFGLNALMVGKPIGALLTSSQFMAVSTTGAIALTAGNSLVGLGGDEHARALFTLTLLAGIIQVAAGLLDLGRLMRFVSNAVMVGFLTGVSVVIVLSQSGDLTGYTSAYSNNLVKAIDLFFNPRQVDPQSLAVGLLTLVLISALARTRLRNFAMLLAMLIASFARFFLSWDQVRVVGDVAEITGGLPLPVLPELSLLPHLLGPALAIATIGLVQGAGVSKAYPNPDGTYPDVSRDFVGQGAANMAAGIFQGMPIGGSVGTTALSVSAGARTRWANVFSGLIIATVVLLFSRAVSLVAMPAMAGLLIAAGFQSIDMKELTAVWRVGWGSRFVMLVTLAMTLALPIQYAVLAGVVLSGLVYIVSSAQDMRLVEIVITPDGKFREQPAPEQLPSQTVTILNVYGSVFFAAAYQLEKLLPPIGEAENPVVILRMRYASRLGSTFINVLEHYETELKKRGGKLILAGVSRSVKVQLDHTETTEDVLGEEDIFVATDVLGESTQAALKAARGWLGENQIST